MSKEKSSCVLWCVIPWKDKTCKECVGCHVAYNENIGALQLTRVGSRRVIQVGACIMIVISVIGVP